MEQIGPGVFFMPHHAQLNLGASSSVMSNGMAYFGTPVQTNNGMFNFWTAWTESAVATNTCTNCGISCYNPSASSTYMDMSGMPPSTITSGNINLDGGQAMDVVCLQGTGGPVCTSSMYQFFNIASQTGLTDATTCGTIGLAPAGDNSIAMDLYSQSLIKNPIVTFGCDGLYFGDRPDISSACANNTHWYPFSANTDNYDNGIWSLDMKELDAGSTVNDVEIYGIFDNSVNDLVIPTSYYDQFKTAIQSNATNGWDCSTGTCMTAQNKCWYEWFEYMPSLSFKFDHASFIFAAGAYAYNDTVTGMCIASVTSTTGSNVILGQTFFENFSVSLDYNKGTISLGMGPHGQLNKASILGYGSNIAWIVCLIVFGGLAFFVLAVIIERKKTAKEAEEEAAEK
jgi:hypothetical protein